ncbi:fatty acid hydroxylase [Thalassoporum mexicanum PCC 7367]|uniref:sterol desaturase family protein n=1 Tax=Thalassoporum mexicanum TaxID=3457544 RepID=UPI00029FB9B8|nr:sterol desaturase family protein [Pseudanabaena sp. PCC 7367]AFY70508.1 fatty acid hydroxylase [Pseudanabaena sp. PCC 7367]
MNPKSIVLIASILGFGLLENLLPFFNYRRSLIARILPNVVLAIVNTLAASVSITFLLQWVWQQTTITGLLSGINEQSPAIAALVTFVVLDFYIYWWHRLMHTSDLGWRFHRVHHTELEMNVSSAYRFHFLEVLVSNLPKLPLILLLGIAPRYFIAYDVVFTAIVCFHHSNWSLPKRIDHLLSYITVTPNFHRVHHSQIMAETNSNYGSVFSWWDRLFGTFRQRQDPQGIKLGLVEFPQSLNPIELWALPFRPLRSLQSLQSLQSLKSPESSETRA